MNWNVILTLVAVAWELAGSPSVAAMIRKAEQLGVDGAAIWAAIDSNSGATAVTAALQKLIDDFLAAPAQK